MKLLSGQNTIVSPNAATKKVIQQEFAALKQKKQTFTILVLLFICMIGWGIVSLFSSQRGSKVDTELIKLSKPITPTIDAVSLAKLEAKRDFSEDELSSFTIYRIVVDPKSQKERIISIDEQPTEEEISR